MRLARACLAPLLVVVFASVLSGCGPYLRYELKHERHFQATRACGQGPFELDVEPLGTRLGESYRLHVCSPRALVGRYEVVAADGSLLASGTFAKSMVRGFDREQGRAIQRSIARPDNERCLAEPVATELSPEPPLPAWPEPPPPPAEAWAPVAPAPPYLPPDVPFVEEPVEEPPVFVETMTPTQLVEVPVRELACPTNQLGRIDIFTREHRLGHSEGTSGAPTEPFRVVLWSEEPNDLEGATFVLTQSEATSSEGSDESYLASLREREAEARLRAEEDARKRRERAEYCAAHVDDVFCWGLGGKKEHDRRRAAEARRREEDARRYAARARRARAEARARPQPPTPTPTCTEPSGPPPAAPDELTPPRPTPRSEWVPGHYTFACVEWVWSSGFWRVPDEDLVEERWVLTAPTPPPPPPVEAPPRVIVVDVGLVWTPGTWTYVNGRYLWVPGSYRAPPHPDARWRPGEWRRERGRVRFVPGRWE